MRLTDQQIQIIRQLAQEVAGSQSRVRVFGSRLDDAANGGDLYLMLEFPEPVDNPSPLASQISARVALALHGRNVEVPPSSPNSHPVPLPVVAFSERQLQ